ncbi:hypothetical protein Ait01nite_023670 [Actinoplanes italicus]|uniref:Uncharacterized protein (TIGR03083 family) n=1 Tax=Actinoplanes italicus TaxID=113567 RepID=A0A2T0KFU7_9ACTN|nr:maleylpyruvate isomerase family mycothiol-dependent enzyme [Actinoplanes italicus]PRX22257.1 uncharacterized protein (TIGR03083 family) [Actinoplanes italicus]GIE29322.1 hypothetical protein Ait01nite_023670 [Actinoplanes italicus]
MTSPQNWVAPTCRGLADLLEAVPGQSWDAPSLCEKWLVRHVIAHVTMPVRLSPERFGAEMAAAGGDFTVLSDTVAERDASLPIADLLDQLRSPSLHAWQPPGGGAAGALSHAVIHSLDVTIALGRPAVAPDGAISAVLDRLAAAGGAMFGLDLTGVRLEAADGAASGLDLAGVAAEVADTVWSWGEGRTVRAERTALVALLSGRTLPDGSRLPRA